jgi:glycolate oxidase FAD binding subunit
MAAASELLPAAETTAPPDQEALADCIRQAAARRQAIYPLGGQTGLRYGLPPKQPGLGLSLSGLTRTIDYPARDMTITVEAGITMAELARTLAAERQRLPIDAPQASRATLGGVIATNTSGPRRYSCGTIRDYVIGITAVDGRGVTFHAGGRVVKNVAGYDLCKLLCGSLGTLAVMTQVTLKLKPLPPATALVACPLESAAAAEPLLAGLVTSSTTPAAIELLVGRVAQDAILPQSLGAPATRSAPRSGSRSACLLIGLEGAPAEVEWMAGQLGAELRAAGRDSQVILGPAADALWGRLTEFPAEADGLVLKASILPSGTTGYIERLLEVDPDCSILAHAANGVVLARTSIAPADAASALVKRLQPAAAAAQGNIVVLAWPDGMELTRRVVWGNTPGDLPLMQSVKNQFDPQGVLNPGRFVY